MDHRAARYGCLSWVRTLEYLIFEREEITGRKTPIIRILSRSSGALLGRIRWYGAWRQFCFWPEPQTLFNVGCMKDIEAKIAELMAERRIDQ